MNKPYAAPADYTEELYVAIPMAPVTSNGTKLSEGER